MAVADKIMVDGKVVAFGTVDWSFDGASLSVSKDFFTKALDTLDSLPTYTLDSSPTYRRVVRPALTPEQLELYPEKVELDVTMMDIYQGVRGDAMRCAVALAVGRRFDGAVCSVNGGGVTIMEDHSGPVMIRYEDPSGALANFIQRFDHPFQSFQIADYGPRPTTITLTRRADRGPRSFVVLGDIS